MRERSLLSQAKDGDMFAFEALVERHRDELYSFGYWMTRSETDAAEIAQVCFLSAHLHLKDFRTEAGLGAWVYWIAAGHASIRQRLHHSAQAAEQELKSPRFHASGVLAQRPRAEWSGDADERALNAALRRAIEDATEGLPQTHREVFLLKDLAGLSYEQVANITGESIRAVKDYLHQARLSLRETIDRFHSE
jgi:RNA polymerase sigma-70 factor (ECF subfamily)